VRNQQPNLGGTFRRALTGREAETRGECRKAHLSNARPVALRGIKRNLFLYSTREKQDSVIGTKLFWNEFRSGNGRKKW
jgi:hypothetical protein